MSFTVVHEVVVQSDTVTCNMSIVSTFVKGAYFTCECNANGH